MPTVEVNENNFRETVAPGGLVVVDCWAQWCGACTTFQPIYERVARRHPSHTFAKLDTQKEKKLREALEIAQIPTLLVYRDGLLLLKHAGSPDEKALEDIVSQASGLDMRRVRAELAAEEAKPPETAQRSETPPSRAFDRRSP
jgi:thioredoxin 1